MSRMKKVIYISLIAILVLSTESVVGNRLADAYQGNGEGTYSKDQIFQGIFFGYGEFGNKVFKDIYQNFSDKQQEILRSEEYKIAIDKITRLISKEDPGYLDELAAAVYSKNPYKIDQALSRGGKLIYTVIHDHAQELNFKTADGVQDPARAEGLAVGITLLYYLAWGAETVVVGLYVAGVEVYLALTSVQYVWQALYWPESASVHASDFDKEQLVAVIISAL
ncbi:MAG: hypothetical protein IMX04_06085 [Candidatus Carbobacillus altaicus]|nr:hypothetical protein [Candidatus Carbobacillus altaicus]